MTRETDRAYLQRPAGDPPALPSGRSLAVLIVSCKNHDGLQTCLHSVAEHLPKLPVYVYDSRGGDAPVARNWSPATRRFTGCRDR
ncbi:hypothetical protein NIIDMKKI_11430 [Mycobacterium kansasii]|uniref:Uncharacterized protein n=1 Tax=Mycobacterium kansasii TaxID=1768 RepID=A0A7G1I4J8_MYCKA|nr:hypothetical protein NIIDMKKI_11430 [Mycobacterium kansasii]